MGDVGIIVVQCTYLFHAFPGTAQKLYTYNWIACDLVDIPDSDQGDYEAGSDIKREVQFMAVSHARRLCDAVTEDEPFI